MFYLFIFLLSSFLHPHVTKIPYFIIFFVLKIPFSYFFRLSSWWEILLIFLHVRKSWFLLSFLKDVIEVSWQFFFFFWYLLKMLCHFLLVSPEKSVVIWQLSQDILSILLLKYFNIFVFSFQKVYYDVSWCGLLWWWIAWSSLSFLNLKD